MYPSAQRTALLVAVILKRSGKTRARMSEKTIRVLSARSTLRGAFLSSVRGWLEDFGVMLTQLERGGFAVVTISALEGAQPIRAKEFLPASERAQLTDADLAAELEVRALEDEE